MKNFFIHRSWQQLTLELFVFTVLLSYSVHASVVIPDYDDESVQYIVRQQMQPDRDCQICFTYYDLESCVRCRNSLPFGAVKREYSMQRPRAIRSDMCGCCALTRLSNSYCCDLCNASKRGG
ncbi:hypothetical protein BsWGS_01789 [Bradybaena similaris]